MDKENSETIKNGNPIKICLAISFFLFAVSVCLLGILLQRNADEESLGAFLDLSPDFGSNSRFAIIGGRVFYPDSEPENQTFPKEVPEKLAVEKTDDASEGILTLVETDQTVSDALTKDTIKAGHEYYTVSRYTSGGGVGKNKDDVKYIELLTFTEDGLRTWTQDADIDLFRNDTGHIEHLAPGTEGYFRFRLNNKSGSAVHAIMTVKEPEDGMHLPMVFSLEDEKSGKVTSEVVLDKDDSVNMIFDLGKDDSGIYRLNWRWPYESGDDQYDALQGIISGRYILNTKIYAETSE